MAQLATAFQTAQSNIEPSEDDWDNAPAAHDEVGQILAAHEDLKAWGVNPILIGSYGRRVSIRRVYDVDMFCRLDEYPTGLEPSKILDAVHAALSEEYEEGAIERFDRSITVKVPDADGLYVDVVPARPVGESWEIPTKSGDWVPTNPIEMTRLKESMNEAHDGKYVPCVKLLRQVRRNLMGRTKLGGFTVEMAFYTACDEGQVSGESMAEYFASAMEGVSDVLGRMADGFVLPDPSMPGEVLEFDEESELSHAAEVFAAASIEARAAFDLDESEAGRAALKLQKLFGSNDDYENVFPMPAGFDSNGNKRAGLESSLAGSRSTTAGDLRFG